MWHLVYPIKDIKGVLENISVFFTKNNLNSEILRNILYYLNTTLVYSFTQRNNIKNHRSFQDLKVRH